VTDAVLETVAEWQNRPLEPMYPLVFFDALQVKIRDEGLVRNKAVYVALGVTPEGTKDILGLWIETSEGAKFWLRVMNELKNRGVEDILIAVVDGLKGFPEAIAAVFPPTIMQTCIVHLIRNYMDCTSWKDRKPIAAELKAICRADGRGPGSQGAGGFRRRRRKAFLRPIGVRDKMVQRLIRPLDATRLEAGRNRLVAFALARNSPAIRVSIRRPLRIKRESKPSAQMVMKQ
jgi:transposase-like protein